MKASQNVTSRPTPPPTDWKEKGVKGVIRGRTENFRKVQKRPFLAFASGDLFTKTKEMVIILFFDPYFDFFSHPEVYTLILPGFGLIFQIINQNIGKTEIFSKLNIIYAIISIVILGFISHGLGEKISFQKLGRIFSIIYRSKII